MPITTEYLRNAVRNIDWNDLEAIRSTSSYLLKQIVSDRECLGRLIVNAVNDPDLRELFEHYDILDKFVLLDDPTSGVRLRLHIFLPGYFDRPHNHRWKYTTLILNGGYRHYTYLPHDYTADREIRDMSPVIASFEGVGNSYTYDARMFHSIIAEPNTVTLILRGPSEKSEFLVVDRETKESWWQYGSKQESPEARANKMMNDTQLEIGLGVLRGAGLLECPAAAA